MLDGLSWLYAKAIDARNSLYTRKLIKVVRPPAPTISVGNIAAGGTGKTPLVEYIARYLAERGKNVCIISRGYKRKDESVRVLVSDKKMLLADASDSGDEPYELALRLLGKAYVVCDRDRAAGSKWAYDEFGISSFVLDDAFQHRRAGRDLDIVVLDATNPFGGFKTLPSGILRERPENLARADVIVITRSNLCDNIEAIIKSAEYFAPEVPIFLSSNQTDGFRHLDDLINRTDTMLPTLSEKTFLFCGLGNPENFFQQMTQTGIDVVGTMTFRDHHHYRGKDVLEIQKKAEDSGAGALVTTVKDAVKLNAHEFRLPCFVCETRLSFANKEGFTEIIDKALIQSIV